MSSRRARAAAKDEKAPARQKEEYAFNTLGWAMNIPIVDDAKIAMSTTIINAYMPSTTPWAKVVTGMEKRGEDPYRKSLLFTTRESEPNSDAGVQRYLLVGFTLNGLLEKHSKKHPSQKKQRPVGTCLNPEGTISSNDDLPLMVVTQMQESEQPKVDLYVLLRPKLGLCTPFHVGHKDCFYLPIFRDGTTDLKKRGLQALRPSDHEPSAKQLQFKRGKNTSKVVLEPKVSLQNEISCLVECFAKTNDMWHLKELESILLQAEKDLVYIPPTTSTTMRRFLDNAEAFEGSDPYVMKEEVEALWPELKIEAADYTVLKEQLVRGDIFVEYRFLRPFLAEGSFRIRTILWGEDSYGVLTEAARDALATVQRVLGSCESAAPRLTADDESQLISAILSSLKSVLKAAREFDKNLKDSCGDQTMQGTLQDVWERYAEAVDTDAAKLAWTQAVRYLTAAQRHKQYGVANMLEDLVLVLDELKL